MATQQQIAKEHGMSFESVVRLYAEHGYSMSGAAKILGYNPSAFVRLCTRRGWRGLFVSGQQSIACKAAHIRASK